VQGWGEKVTTTGYGTLANLSQDGRQKYASAFNGTSSGGGHVGGIVAAVQSYAMRRLGKPLTSRQMRGLLIATGHRQGADSLTGHIGPLPDIRAALDSLDRMASSTGWTGARPPLPQRWSLGPGRLMGRGTPGSGAEVGLLDASGRLRFSAGLRFGAEGAAEAALPMLPAGAYRLRIRNGTASPAPAVAETRGLVLLP
jgi:hypothetical protein